MTAVSAPPRRRVAAAVTTAALLLVGAPCSSDSGTASTSTPTSTRASSAASPPGTETTTPARASGESAGCDAASVVPAGTTDERIRSGGVERSYQLIVPEGYDGATPLPVVFGLHSLTVDYRIVPAMSGFARTNSGS